MLLSRAVVIVVDGFNCKKTVIPTTKTVLYTCKVQTNFLHRPCIKEVWNLWL